MNDLLKKLESLSPEKRELVLKKLRERGAPSGKPAAQDTPTITPQRRDGIIPLSFAQQRLWFLWRIEGESSTYNMSTALRMRGKLDIAALEKGVSEIVRRHESLRTIFVEKDGVPSQVINPPAPLAISIIDLSSVAEDERRTAMRRIAGEEASRPFDLSTGPLLRITLARLADDDHVFVAVMHHIVSDGWSMGVFTKELTALYGAFVNHSASPLAELPLQYADFAIWQREWMEGARLEKQLDYWSKNLADLPRMLELPTDKPRPPIQSFDGAVEIFEIDHYTTRKLNEISRKNEASLFMTVLAAFAVLLAKYARQRDIAIGSPIANRRMKELESLIGFFVNTLVFRVNTESDPTFTELLRQVRATSLVAYDNQDVPFEKLVETLQPERSLSHAPLFQVMFIWQNMTAEKLELPNVTGSYYEMENFVSHFDMALAMTEQDGVLKGALEYCTALFERDTVVNMIAHFKNLLAAIAENPDSPVFTLPILTEDGKQKLAKWNDTRRDYHEISPIHELFEARVEKTGDATAVEFGETRMTYVELNATANRLAAYLRERGAAQDKIIGVMMGRSVLTPLTVLAILKSGCAYMPIDLAYPKARVEEMLADSGAILLMTDGPASGANIHWNGDVIRVDKIIGDLAGHSPENPDHLNRLDDLAYVIYTSGSTGKPKGVAMPHRPLSNLMLWQMEQQWFAPGARTLQFTSLGFDVSFQEIFSTWLSGGTLILVDEDTRKDPDALTEYIRNNDVRRIFLPFVALRQLAESIAQRDNPPLCLREVITAGEQLRVTPQVIKMFSRLGDCVLVNQYGPSETHVVTSHTLAGSPDLWPALPPIGHAIANTTIHILDENLRQTPVGVYGELYIGGDAVARGYLNNAPLTGERFIPDPYNAPNGRMYKTGDLARYMADGGVEFMGRADNQVKIRGFRVEPGEIEASLSRFPNIGDVAVVVREDRENDRRLIAYVAADKNTITASDLREFLRRTLPDYMIPQAFVIMDSLPLTTSGKVNRRALPAPDQDDVATSENFAAPRTALEEIVAGAWAETLRIGAVGVHDNFFDLGGHSLLATRVISRIRDVLQVDVPARVLFESPTVAQLCERLEIIRDSRKTKIPPITRVGRDGVAPLSFAQERLWFLYQMEGAGAAYNMQAALLLKGTLDVGALHKSLNEIVRRHEILRTAFVSVNGAAGQQIVETLTINIDERDLRNLDQEQKELAVVKIIDEESERAFDLAKPPLMRASLLRMNDDEVILAMTFSHIVFDGWSTGIIAEELSTAYAAYAKGEAPVLRELPIQYADFAAWQRGFFDSDVLNGQMEYWKRKLDGAPKRIALPEDKPRPAVFSYKGGIESFEIDAATTRKLKAIGKHAGATLFMTTLAAFAATLARYTGENDIVIGSPIAGRVKKEIEPLIGFFVNSIALRMRFPDDTTFENLLAFARTTTLEAYDNQDAPFERIVRDLKIDRDPSRHPLFQVVFTLQNAPEPKLVMGDLAISPVAGQAPVAKYDLLMALTETGGRIIGSLEYCDALFEKATMTRLMEMFITIVRHVADDPAIGIFDIPLDMAWIGQQPDQNTQDDEADFNF